MQRSHITTIATMGISSDAYGNNASIGAGAVVVKDVPENATVAGVPARVISENNPGRFVNRRWTLPF